MNVLLAVRRSWQLSVIAGVFFALFLALWVTPLRAQFAGGGGTTGIALNVADWVPERDENYGGWGVVAAGASIETPLHWTADAPSLKLDPGSYDVYWVQDYDTRDKPVLLARGVTVEADQLATVDVDSGVKIEVAAWVPLRDENYGWLGAASAGSIGADEPVTTDQMVNWTKTGAAMILPPGEYDVYWAQDYDTRDTPLQLAKGVRVTAGEVQTVEAKAGVRLDVARWVPARDPSYGWWGAVKAGDPPDQRVNWSKSADALLLPAGAYDIYWVQNYAVSNKPMLIARQQNVETAITSVRVDTGIKPEVAAELPPLAEDYGWWGAAPAWRDPDSRVNWSEGQTADALVLPPGRYDIFWKQDYDSPLELKAREVEVTLGALVDVPIGTASIVVTPSVVVAFELRSSDGAAMIDGAFPDGIKEIEARYEWESAEVGRRLGVRWYNEGQMVLEQGEPVANASGETIWSLKTDDGSALPQGMYRVELIEEGELRMPAEFVIGTAAALAPDAASTPDLPAGEDVATAETDAGTGGGTGGEWVLVQVVTTQTEPDISDEFSDPNSGWTVAESATHQLGYVDDAYHIRFEGPGDGWLTGSSGEAIGDGILQVDVSAAADAVGHPFGVFVRGQDSANFHGFVIAKDESYAAFRIQGGQFAMDGEPNKQLPAGVYLHGEPNRIQVFLAADRIVYFLNERQIDEARPIWPTGQAGVLSAGVQGGKAHVSFDDWKVWTMEPEAAPAEEALRQHTPEKDQ